MELKRVGFWNNNRNDYPECPKVEDHIDLTWDREERQVVVDYLKAGRIKAAYKGMSVCRVCTKFNGSEDQTDGVYVWPSGFAHYVSEHGVKPPQEFLEHIWEQVGRVIAESLAEAMKKVRSK